MIRQELKLDGGRATLIMYLHETGTADTTNHLIRPCVLVCPGGGYMKCSTREQDPPALAFFAAGYQVGILIYSLEAEAKNLRPLTQAALAVMCIREHASDWDIMEDKIAIMGFSAGAHVAASLGTLWNHDRLKALLDTKGGLDQPNALILCYPVITTGPYAHEGSAELVSGGDMQLRSFLSLEDRVTNETPQTFLWHTVDDDIVPVENSMMFMSALKRHSVPFEAHLYPSGRHGLSMCNEEVHTVNEHCSSWFGLCLSWLNGLFGFVA